VKKKKINPTQLVKAAIERIEQHAIVFKAYEETRAKVAMKLSASFRHSHLPSRSEGDGRRIGMTMDNCAISPIIH
jgi:hypothetical protein